MRDEHEDSHLPQYRCSDSMCGFFGWRFSTRAAIKKHAVKYHKKSESVPIPTCLPKRARQSGQSRPLFALKEPSSVSGELRLADTKTYDPSRYINKWDDVFPGRAVDQFPFIERGYISSPFPTGDFTFFLSHHTDLEASTPGRNRNDSIAEPSVRPPAVARPLEYDPAVFIQRQSSADAQLRANRADSGRGWDPIDSLPLIGTMEETYFQPHEPIRSANEDAQQVQWGHHQSPQRKTGLTDLLQKANRGHVYSGLVSPVSNDASRLRTSFRNTSMYASL